MDPKRISLGDEEYSAVEVPFETDEENWSVYKLEDGTTIRARLSVLRVFRVVDEDGTPQFTDDDEPHVIIRHKVDVVTVGA